MNAFITLQYKNLSKNHLKMRYYDNKKMNWKR